MALAQLGLRQPEQPPAAGPPLPSRGAIRYFIVPRSEAGVPIRETAAGVWNIAVRGESRASTETGPAPAGQGATEGAYREYVSR